MPKCQGVKVPKLQAESLRKILASRSLIHPSLKPFSDSDFVYFPIRAQIPDELDLSGIQFWISEYDFPSRSNPDYSELGFSPRYELVGRIAVLEGDYDLETATKIGKFLVSRFRNIDTAVLPLTSVETEHRIRKYLILAGKRSMVTLHRENKLSFIVDLSKAYFNPKLAGERLRVSSKIQPHEIVLDMFAGIGGFTIYAAKRALKVIAVDINPHAIKLLKLNLKLNRISNVDVYCSDIRDLEFQSVADRVIMDLPLNSRKYLDLGVSFAKHGGVIHYYTISSMEEIQDHISQLESEFGLKCLELHRIGSYAPRIHKFALDLLVQNDP